MKIICIGRNYADHAKELANPIPDAPLLFFKPDTALLRNNQDFYYPDFSNDIHHECELVYLIGKEGKHVNRRFAREYVSGVGLGIDFTARDLQAIAKAKGHPWTLAKMFNNSAPVSRFLGVEEFPNWNDIRFELRVNGESRQKGWTGDLLFDLEYLIEYITRFITLKKGDLIFTGTPAGVAPVKVGDRLQASLEQHELLDFYVR
ncbi:MAG TPA: FAA hydrolase family protein [Bacteroidetes bacterium]|nr:FAA hydrolase family protein [Bacteroidota bacterium]